MEYVIVKFKESRKVFVDEQENGVTNQSIMLGTGRHTFTLGGNKNFKPVSCDVDVINTTIIKPLIINFEVKP